MVLEKITAQAQQIKSFASLPATAQVSILYAEIDAARKLSIPLTAICEALNSAGSTITVRYLRQTLYVVKKRLEKAGSAIPAPTQVPPAVAKQSQVPRDSALPQDSTLTPKQARENKANSYMTSSNQLLAQLKKPDSKE